MSLGKKARLLNSDNLLTRQFVANALKMKIKSASNLLTQWNHEGLVKRTGPGIYISTLNKNAEENLILQTVRNTFGNDLIIVGSSSWEKAGWAQSHDLQVAIPLAPSRRLPKIACATVYPVGSKMFQHLHRHSLIPSLSEPPVLHPVVQMLWWMEQDCPVQMPAPNTILWEKLKTNDELIETVRSTWPEMRRVGHLDIEQLYEMIHMDRLTGTIPGQAESLDGQDEGDEHGERPS